MPSLADLKDITSHGSNKEMYSEFMHQLAEPKKDGKVLPAALSQRVQACFLPLVSKHC